MTTKDKTAPVLSEATPKKGMTSVDITQNVIFTFNEAIVAGNGKIIISNAKGDTRIISLNPLDSTSSQVSFSGKNLVINPLDNLLANSRYSIQIDNKAVKDASGNFYAGIKNTTTLSFDTTDTNAPKFKTSSPILNAKNIAANATLRFTFDEKIKLGTGNITLISENDTRTIPINDEQITLSGNTLIFNPAVDLNVKSQYKVRIDAGAIQDLAPVANSALGVNVNFTTKTTGDKQVPIIEDYTIDSKNNNLQLIFQEPIKMGKGSFKLSTNGEPQLVISANDVSIHGNVATLSATLTLGKTYTISAPKGFVRDLAGNALNEWTAKVSPSSSPDEHKIVPPTLATLLAMNPDTDFISAAKAALIPTEVAYNKMIANRITIRDTPANIQKYWDTLTLLNLDPPFGRIEFKNTDGSNILNPILELKSSQFELDQQTDATHGLLKFITSHYKLVISDLSTYDIDNANNETLISQFMVQDTIENITKNWSKLEKALELGKLQGIKITDGTNLNIVDLVKINQPSGGRNPTFAGINQTSLNLLKMIQSDHFFNVDVYVDSLPTDMWTALSDVKKSNSHINSLSIILKENALISSHAFLSLQDAYNQKPGTEATPNNVAGLKLDSSKINNLIWNISDIQDIDNVDTPIIHLVPTPADKNKIINIDFQNTLNDYVFNIHDIHSMLSSYFYQYVIGQNNLGVKFTFSLNNAFNIADTSTNINANINAIAQLIKLNSVILKSTDNNSIHWHVVTDEIHALTIDPNTNKVIDKANAVLVDKINHFFALNKDLSLLIYNSLDQLRQLDLSAIWNTNVIIKVADSVSRSDAPITILNSNHHLTIDLSNVKDITKVNVSSNYNHMADVEVTTSDNSIIHFIIEDIEFTQLTKSAFRGIDFAELTLNVDVNTMWPVLSQTDDHTSLVIEDTASNISKYWQALVEQPSRIKEIIVTDSQPITVNDLFFDPLNTRDYFAKLNPNSVDLLKKVNYNNNKQIFNIANTLGGVPSNDSNSDGKADLWDALANLGLKNTLNFIDDNENLSVTVDDLSAFQHAKASLILHGYRFNGSNVHIGLSTTDDENKANLADNWDFFSTQNTPHLSFSTSNATQIHRLINSTFNQFIEKFNTESATVQIADSVENLTMYFDDVVALNEVGVDTQVYITAPHTNLPIEKNSNGDLAGSLDSVLPMGVLNAGHYTLSQSDAVSDTDWFKIILDAGVSYQINVDDSPSAKGILGDTYLYGIYDKNGNEIEGFKNDDSNGSKNAQVIFIPKESGVYYLSAGAYFSENTGAYTLSVRPVSSSDYTLSVNASQLKSNNALTVLNAIENSYSLSITLSKDDSIIDLSSLSSSTLSKITLKPTDLTLHKNVIVDSKSKVSIDLSALTHIENKVTEQITKEGIELIFTDTTGKEHTLSLVGLHDNTNISFNRSVEITYRDLAANISANWAALKAMPQITHIEVSDNGLVSVPDLFKVDNNTSSMDVVNASTVALLKKFNLTKEAEGFRILIENNTGDDVVPNASSLMWTNLKNIGLTAPVHLVAAGHNLTLSDSSLAAIQHAIANHIIVDFQSQNTGNIDFNGDFTKIGNITDANVFERNLNSAPIKLDASGLSAPIDTSVVKNIVQSAIYEALTTTGITPYYYLTPKISDSAAAISQHLASLKTFETFFTNSQIQLSDATFPVITVHNIQDITTYQSVLDSISNGSYGLQIADTWHDLSALNLTTNELGFATLVITPSDLGNSDHAQITLTVPSNTEINVDLTAFSNITKVVKTVTDKQVSLAISLQDDPLTHTLTLKGATSQFVVIQTPHLSDLVSVSAANTSLGKEVLASQALSYAVKNVGTFDVYDSKENIIAHLSDLITINKAGKLNTIIERSGQALDLGNILSAYDLPILGATENIIGASNVPFVFKKLGDNDKFSIYDTSSNISKNWQSILNNSQKLTSITVTDNGSIKIPLQIDALGQIKNLDVLGKIQHPSQTNVLFETDSPSIFTQEVAIVNQQLAASTLNIALAYTGGALNITILDILAFQMSVFYGGVTKLLYMNSVDSMTMHLTGKLGDLASFTNSGIIKRDATLKKIPLKIIFDSQDWNVIDAPLVDGILASPLYSEIMTSTSFHKFDSLAVKSNSFAAIYADVANIKQFTDTLTNKLKIILNNNETVILKVNMLSDDVKKYIFNNLDSTSLNSFVIEDKTSELAKLDISQIQHTANFTVKPMDLDGRISEIMTNNGIIHVDLSAFDHLIIDKQPNAQGGTDLLITQNGVSSTMTFDQVPFANLKITYQDTNKTNQYLHQTSASNLSLEAPESGEKLIVTDTFANIWENRAKLIHNDRIASINVSDIAGKIDIKALDDISIELLTSPKIHFQTTNEISVHITDLRDYKWVPVLMAGRVPVLHIILDNDHPYITNDDAQAFQQFWETSKTTAIDLTINSRDVTLKVSGPLPVITEQQKQGLKFINVNKIILDGLPQQIDTSIIKNIADLGVLQAWKANSTVPKNTDVLYHVTDSAEKISANFDQLVLFSELYSTNSAFSDQVKLPVISISAKQFIDGKALLTKLSSHYLLSISYDKNDAKTLDLRSLSNTSVELKPSDWSAAAALSDIKFDASLKGIDLTALASSNANLAAVQNAVAQSNANTIKIYEPLIASGDRVDNSKIIAGIATDIPIAQALTYALHPTVKAITLKDTASNIENGWSQIVQAYKYGKLTGLMVTDSGTIKLPLLNDIEKNITPLIDQNSLPQFVYCMDAKDVANSDVSAIIVNSSAFDINKYWLTLAEKANAIKEIVVSDQGAVMVADLFHSALDSTGNFNQANQNSLQLIKNLSKANSVIIETRFSDSRSQLDINELPLGMYPTLRQLKTEMNGTHIHLVASNKVDTRISTHDLLFLQENIKNNVVDDFTLESFNNSKDNPLVITWDKPDFIYAPLITNANTLQLAEKFNNDDKTAAGGIQFSESAAFTAPQVNQFIKSFIYKTLQDMKFYEYSSIPAISKIEDSASAIESNLGAISTLITQTPKLFGVNYDYINLQTSTVDPTIHINDGAKVLQIASTDIARFAPALKAIEGSYLLVIKGSSSELNSMDLSLLDIAKHPNIKIELKPTDLKNDIAIKATYTFDEKDGTGKVLNTYQTPSSSIISVDLTALSSVKTIVAPPDLLANGELAKDVVKVTHHNGQTHVIYLPNKSIMTVYKPLDLIAEAASTGTNQEFVTVAEALNIAANNTVLTLKIKDSASEIARHFDALINIQRAGKLLDVSVNDPVDGQYVLPFPKLSTTNQNLLASQVINLTHWNASTSDIAKKFANSNVTSINVIDSLANIQKNIDILQADNSKIHTVSFTNDDTQNVLSLTYDQYANDVDVLAKIASPHSIVVTSGKSTNSSNFYKAGNSMESLNYYGILKNLDVDHNNVTLKYNAAKNEVIKMTHFNSGDSVQFTDADNKAISIAQLHFYNTSVDNQFGVLISTAPSNQNTFNGVFIAGLTLSMLNKNATDDIIFDDNTLDNINLETYQGHIAIVGTPLHI